MVIKAFLAPKVFYSGELSGAQGPPYNDSVFHPALTEPPPWNHSGNSIILNP